MSSSMRGVLLCVIATTLFFQDSHAATKTELQQVCQKTEDLQLCYEVFNNDPRTPAADMAKLCLIAVERTVNQVAYITSSKIPWLLGKVTDPEVRRSIERCQSIYGAAAGDFNDAWVSATEKAFPDVLKQNLKGANQVIDCENISNGSPLSEDNRVLIKVTRITVVVLKLLGVT